MEHLAKLLLTGQVITLCRVDADHLVISLADVESDDDMLYYVPTHLMLSKESSTLSQALESFCVRCEAMSKEAMHA